MDKLAKFMFGLYKQCSYIDVVKEGAGLLKLLHHFKRVFVLHRFIVLHLLYTLLQLGYGLVTLLQFILELLLFSLAFGQLLAQIITLLG